MFFGNKSHNAEKIEMADPLVSIGFFCYAENGITFLVQFPGPNGSI